MAGVSGILASSGPSAYWYLTRSTGAVALLLLTLSVAMGVMDRERAQTARLPRFVIDALHRNISLLALVFLIVHIVTSVLDGFVSISLLDAVVPFVGSYRPLWLGLGAVAFDLFLAVILTSLLRARIGYRTWRALHWLAYLSWPVALVHALGTGSDVNATWLRLLGVACVLIVLVALATRLRGASVSPRLRGAALAGTGAFLVFLAVWLPSGPFAAGWARRAGTPASVLVRTHDGGGSRR